MISRDNCIDSLLHIVPEFIPQWQIYKDFWEGDESGLCNDFSEFSDFIIKTIDTLEEQKKIDIFNFIENCVICGDEYIKTAAATCFLENLLNAFSDGDIHPKSFVYLLGTESKEYCKAWDEFTGLRTPILWD